MPSLNANLLALGELYSTLATYWTTWPVSVVTYHDRREHARVGLCLPSEVPVQVFTEVLRSGEQELCTLSPLTYQESGFLRVMANS